MLQKIDGCLAVPHELLHVLAYRLIGKKCRYRLGSHVVQPLEERSWGQKLFVLLLPFLVIGGAGLGLMALWTISYIALGYPANPLAYFQIAPVWHKLLWVGSIILLLYSGSAFNDIRAAVRLLTQNLGQKPPNHPDDKQHHRQRAG